LSNLTEQSDFYLYISTMATPPESLTAAKNDAPLKTKELKAPINGVTPYKDVSESSGPHSDSVVRWVYEVL
jgi:hypothetical protein